MQGMPFACKMYPEDKIMARVQTKGKVMDMVLMAMMSAVIAICSWISIPGPVPFTLQTCAVFLTLKLLGGWKGMGVIALYLLLGLVGVPVFAGFGSGPAVLTGYTGGFLFGFIGIAAVYSLYMTQKRNHWMENAFLAAGLVLCYACGCLQFSLVATANGSSKALWDILKACVIPFIIPDLLKLYVADLIAPRIKKAMHY